jgi:5'-deoxynucleotidase YfbR-like HD superfamily hydrolase
MLTRQTDAEHAWRVATIYCEVFGLPRAEVLFYCLHHDSGELWGGDIPFSVKAATPGMREASNLAEAEGLRRLGITMPKLDPDEFSRVKVSDLLEMWEHGRHELRLGNQYALPVVQDTYSEVLGRLDRLPLGDGTRVTAWTGEQTRRLP